MKKSISLLTVSALSILLAGCTLTPSHFNGYDLLDTEHKTEMQDPVIPPSKEHSDRPVTKAVAVPAPLSKAPVAKPVEPVKPLPVAKIPEAPMPAEKKAEPIVQKKVEPAKPQEACGDHKKGEILPPPAPGTTIKPVEKADVKKNETLKSGDRLQINVFREKDLTGVYQINDKGMITFPMIGQVAAGGMKPDALQEKLKTDLSKGYLVKPEVSVELLPDCITK